MYVYVYWHISRSTSASPLLSTALLSPPPLPFSSLVTSLNGSLLLLRLPLTISTGFPIVQLDAPSVTHLSPHSASRSFSSPQTPRFHLVAPLFNSFSPRVRRQVFIQYTFPSLGISSFELAPRTLYPKDGPLRTYFPPIQKKSRVRSKVLPQRLARSSVYSEC